jgi:hypothetical protein
VLKTVKEKKKERKRERKREGGERDKEREKGERDKEREREYDFSLTPYGAPHARSGLTL